MPEFRGPEMEIPEEEMGVEPSVEGQENKHKEGYVTNGRITSIEENDDGTISVRVIASFRWEGRPLRGNSGGEATILMTEKDLGDLNTPTDPDKPESPSYYFDNYPVYEYTDGRVMSKRALEISAAEKNELGMAA